VPADAVVAESRDEFQGAMLRRQFPALGEAADGQNVTVRRAHVPLVRAVLSNSCKEGLDCDGGLVIGVFERS